MVHRSRSNSAAVKDVQVAFRKEEFARDMGQRILNHNTGSANQPKRWSVQAGGM